MARCKSIFEALDKTISMEFYLRGKELYIRYNNKEMTLKDFFRMKSPNGKKIIDTIFSYIIRRYKNMDVISNGLRARKSKQEIILEFLIRYFSFDQTPIDVMIHSTGKIDINFENCLLV